MKVRPQSASRRYASMKNYVRRLQKKGGRTGRKSSPHVAERIDAQKDARGKSW